MQGHCGSTEKQGCPSGLVGELLLGTNSQPRGSAEQPLPAHACPFSPVASAVGPFTLTLAPSGAGGPAPAIPGTQRLSLAKPSRIVCRGKQDHGGRAPRTTSLHRLTRAGNTTLEPESDNGFPTPSHDGVAEASLASSLPERETQPHVCKGSQTLDNKQYRP